MRPTVPELIASIRWTFAERIAPVLSHDPLAQSYGRGILNALASVEIRLRVEEEVLLEEIADLSTVLLSIEHFSEGGLPTRVRQVLTDPEAQNADVDVVTTQVNVLRESLIAMIRVLPPEQQGTIRGYLARQVERDARLTPTSGHGFF